MCASALYPSREADMHLDPLPENLSITLWQALCQGPLEARWNHHSSQALLTYPFLRVLALEASHLFLDEPHFLVLC